MLKERRIHPRQAVSFPVWLTALAASGPVELKAEAVDLSLGGIRVNCHASVLSCLQELARYPVTCLIRFRMPGSGQEVNCECRLIVSRRLEQHQYQLGFKFTAYLDDSHEHLQDFLGTG